MVSVMIVTPMVAREAASPPPLLPDQIDCFVCERFDCSSSIFYKLEKHQYFEFDQLSSNFRFAEETLWLIITITVFNYM